MTNPEKIALCREVVDRIQAESGRPVCRLRFSQEPFGIAGSHLGGTPYLPRDASYPMGEDGQPLWLCAQINFAQMPPMEGFPGEGILQFFLSDWRYDGGFGLYSGDGFIQNQWRVLYHPTVDETVTGAECRAKMPIPWEEANADNMGRPKNQLDELGIKNSLKYGAAMEQALELWRVPSRPLKMNFPPVEREGVCLTDFRFDRLFDRALEERLPGAAPEDFKPYGIREDTPEERTAVSAVRQQAKNGGCKLGGYPRYEQDDPREYGEELEAWDTLLFQLDDDPRTYPAGELGKDLGEMDINLNGGTLNFLIRAEDLKNRDFSRVLAQWACS